MNPTKPKSIFSRFARWTAVKTGKPSTFMFAVGVIVLWAISGPIFRFSDTWQLIINTATTIVTFLMVFLIQCTQNRDTEAMQVKLDEIIHSIKGAQNALMDLEELEEEELDQIRDEYRKMAERARGEWRKTRLHKN